MSRCCRPDHFLVPVHGRSQTVLSGAEFPFKMGTPAFVPSNITIVTHGMCGSTCALFTDHASLYEHVKTVVVGVHEPANQQVTSFPGLQVLEDSEIMNEIEAANITGDLVPQRFVGGTWRACVREIYG